MTKCDGSGKRVGTSVGQRLLTGGYVRANKATGVHCPVCHRRFESARIAHTDHGIPTAPLAIIPTHRKGTP